MDNKDTELKEQHKKIFSKKLNFFMKLNHKKQDDIINDLGIKKSTISTWCRGEKMPRVNGIQLLADYFNVQISDFLTDEETNIMAIPQMVKKPRLGVIACGEPILAAENIDDYDLVPENINCDFTLLCKGDSMINARINDGDIVYIREQPQVENGEIAAVLIDNEATLKRVYIYKDKVVLQPENTKYSPMAYSKEEMNEIRILGKAVGFTSLIK